MSGEPVRRTAILFVCLGNICRSPLAKAVFIHLAQERNLLSRFDVDSCGTGHWHVGESADRRAALVAAKYGIELTHSARQFDPAADLARFDYLIAMDSSNAHALMSAGAPPERVFLMRSFTTRQPGTGPGHADVPDPYYGDGDGFERVYHILAESTQALLDHLLAAPR